MTVAAFLVLHALETLRAPRKQARRVMSYDLSRSERWQALALNIVVGTLLLWLSIYLDMTGVSARPQTIQALISALVLQSPIMAATIQVCFAVASVYALYMCGRLFGGKGDLDSTISLMAWMAFVLNLVGLLQILAWAVFPFLAELIGIFASVLVFVMLTCFCAELHGFRSLFMTFIGIIFTIFVILFGFTLFFSSLVAFAKASMSGVPL